MLTIGTSFYESGDFNSALPFYLEASRASIYGNWCDPLTTVQTQRMMAVLKGIDGNRRGALADLKKLLPLARIVGSTYPYDLYSHFNSLAVELAEAGQLEEAGHFCRITLAPSFADAYPEVRETYNDIVLRSRRASRSIVAFNHICIEGKNVAHIPEPEPSDSTDSAGSCLSPPQQPARILSYEKWKNKMVKETNNPPKDNKPTKKLDDREKMLRIIQLVSKPERTDQELESILEAVERIVSESEDKD
jgi:hypothetical protein